MKNGDLISRRVLLEKIKKSFLDNSHTSTRMKMVHAEEHNHFRILVNNAPAVDAEPVRHGQWEPMPVSSGRDSWRCSECGRRARGKRENLPYCHCGAKMDAEVGEC